MGGVSRIRDIGAYIKTAFAGYATLTAAGSGDNTEVTSGYVDRLGFDSCSLSIAYRAVLTQDKTLAIACNLQDADTTGGSGLADYGSVNASTVVATGGSGGSTETGVLKYDYDLSEAKRYIRAQFTPDLNNTATDTAVVIAQLILGGAAEVPAA